MRDKRRILLFIFCAVLLVGLGCSEKMTRSKAEEIIRKEEGFPAPYTTLLRYGKICWSDNLGQFDLKELSKQGLVKITELKEKEPGTSISLYNVELTKKGEKYIEEMEEYARDYYRPHNGKKYTAIRVLERKFIQITGMRELQKGKVEIEYQWKYINPTPFGAVWQKRNMYHVGEVQNEKATLILYDEGWRVTN